MARPSACPCSKEVPLVTQVAPQRARRERRAAGHGAHVRPEPPLFPQQQPEPQGPRLRGRHATGYDQGFSGVVTWTVIGSLLPGSGLIAAGRRKAGWFVVLLTLLLAGAVVGFVVLGDAKTTALSVAFDVNDLMQVALALCGAALLWALVVLASHASLRRFSVLTATQRMLSTLLVGSIIAGGGVLAAKAVSISLIQRGVLQDVTANGTQVDNGGKPRSGQADPWASTPRVNVLLIGSDAGADRTGVRTDSVILASIDTHTGDAVLFGIPRNLQHVPFPPGTPMAQQFPDGFYCQDANNPCLFNALWQYGVEHADNAYYRNYKNPGLQATIDGVQAVTGLPVNEYVLLDLKGFASFINAIGGVDVTVQRPIPVAGHENAAGQQVGVKGYIQPGRQHLNGYYALWFARSRSDSSDFDRMARQRCLIGAVTQQVNPVTVARSFPALAEAIRQNLSMSIRLGDLGAWVTLAERVQKGHVRSLPFVEGVISTVRPDFDKIHTMVEQALQQPASTPSPTRKKRHTSGTPNSTPAPTTGTTGQAVDVKEACG
jgi:LCP family protein required for cell wall assembly